MTEEAPAIRRGRVADARALAAFAARAFEETFGADTAADDMAAYLEAAYGERQQRAELEHAEVITLVVEHAHELVGFAQVRRGGLPPACVAAPRALELWRFYVGRAWHGRGLARRLMHAVMDAARELGGGPVWLSVWERNSRAIAFYAKCGFLDVGAKEFVVGSDRQVDRVMLVHVDSPTIQRDSGSAGTADAEHPPGDH